MRVLLTGGYGCIGSWIVRNLLARGDQVFIYDLKEDPAPHAPHPERGAGPPGALRAGRRDRPAGPASGHRDEHGITHIVHLAGLQVPTCRADPILGAKVNVLGTLAVFEAVRQAARPGATAGLRQLRRGVRAAGGLPARAAGRRREADADDALRLLQVLQRGQRPRLLPGPRPVEHRPAALDGLRRRPRLRHDQRADQGDQVARPRPAVSHQLRRLAGFAVRRRRGRRSSCAAWRRRTRERSRTTCAATWSICRRFTRRCARSTRRRRSLITFGERQIGHRLRSRRRAPCSATWARCRRRRWRGHAPNAGTFPAVAGGGTAGYGGLGGIAIEPRPWGEEARLLHLTRSLLVAALQATFVATPKPAAFYLTVAPTSGRCSGRVLVMD